MKFGRMFYEIASTIISEKKIYIYIKCNKNIYHKVTRNKIQIH